MLPHTHAEAGEVLPVFNDLEANSQWSDKILYQQQHKHDQLDGLTGIWTSWRALNWRSWSFTREWIQQKLYRAWHPQLIWMHSLSLKKGKIHNALLWINARHQIQCNGPHYLKITIDLDFLFLSASSKWHILSSIAMTAKPACPHGKNIPAIAL